jgi:hypothetical protein
MWGLKPTKLFGYLWCRKGKTTLVCVIIVAVVVGAAAMGESHFWGSPNCGVRLPEGAVDFGEAWESNDFSVPIRLSNTSRKDARITGFFGSCLCVAVKPETLTIPAQGQADVTVRLDLRSRTFKEAQSSERDFEVYIRPQVEGCNAVTENTWAVRGRVKKAVTLSDPQVLFPELLVRGQQGPKRGIQVSAVDPHFKLQVESKPSQCAATVKRSRRDANKYELQVELNQSLPPGPFLGSVNLRVVGHNGKLITSLPVTVRATIVEDVIACPARILLGTRPIGDRPSEIVTLQSLTGCAFELEGIDTAAEEVSAKRLNNEAGGGKVLVRIDCRVSKRGSQAAAVKLRVTRRNKPALSISVPVEYYGVASQ